MPSIVQRRERCWNVRARRIEGVSTSNSVRGPVRIDPASRDIVQTVYIRKAQQADGGMFNVEFDQVANFADPGV